MGIPYAWGSSLWRRPIVCATYTWVSFHIFPGLGEQGQGGGHEACCAVSNGVLCLWPGSFLSSASRDDTVAGYLANLRDHLHPWRCRATGPDAQIHCISLMLVHSLLRCHFPKGTFLVCLFDILRCVLPTVPPAISLLSVITITWYHNIHLFIMDYQAFPLTCKLYGGQGFVFVSCI